MDDRNKYWGDVIYEVWLSGGNVDRIDDDRVEDMRWDDRSAEEAADIELRHQRPHREFIEEEPNA